MSSNRVGLIELQVITRILTSTNQKEIDALLAYDPDDYYIGYANEIKFIKQRYQATHELPDINEFLMEFPEIVQLPTTTHQLPYLENELRSNRKFMVLNNTMNKLVELGKGDIDAAWKYIATQVELIDRLECSKPMDIIADAEKRAKQLQEYAKQQRIPTGFNELDKALYGGLSTVEELAILVARTNMGKSWICTKITQAAHESGFPVAYYTPEMQPCFLGSRFDTVNRHFRNSDLIRGEYSQEYIDYVAELAKDTVPIYTIQDEDFPDGVSVSVLSNFVKSNGIKLLVVDGISYMKDDLKASRDQDKFKNIAQGLFQLSKKFHCAVFLVMQSNREVRSKDSKEESMPDLFNTEGSDQPGRISTTAFGIRQIREDGKLEIKMLKARNAALQQAVFSYSWSINDGTFAYIENSEDFNNSGTNEMPGSFHSINYGTNGPDAADVSLIEDATSSAENEYEGVEF